MSERIELTVVFANDHFLAADKPPGWLSVPSRGGGQDARPCAGRELERAHGRLFPLHRIDVEVSGLILFARTAEAHREAGAWFESRAIGKRYEAWTEGDPPSAGISQGAELAWELRLLRGKRRAYEHPAGKSARTLARWMGMVSVAGKACSAWELEPVTGRPHQLRYSLAAKGFPVLGDRLYGSTREFGRESGREPASGAIALRSVRLVFAGIPASAAFQLPPVIEVPGLSSYFY